MAHGSQSSEETASAPRWWPRPSRSCRAAGVDLDDRRLRPRRRPLPARRHGPARRGARRAAGVRRHPARRRRHARRAARGDRAGPAAEDALRARPVRQPAAVRSARQGIDFVVIRENTEGTYAGEGGLPPQGHAPRGRHPGLGQHPHGRRALRPLRLRPGRGAAAQAPHARAQDQRAHLRRRPVAAHLRRGGAPSTPTSPPPTTTSTRRASTSCSDPQRYDVIVTDNLFGDILTDLGGAVAGGIGFAASANLNPARTGAVDVRAGPRLGARHRGHRQGQPDRRHPVARR